MRNHSPIRRASAAFTLLELLLSMAVICVLLATLVPAIAKAREQARTCRCLANLRQLGIAHITYASEFENYIVPAAYRDPAYPPPLTKQTEMWCTIFINVGLLPAQGNQRVGFWHRPPASPMAVGVLCCPSGDFSARSNNFPLSLNDVQGRRGARYSSRSSHITVDCWYGMNAATGDTGTIGQSNHWLPGRRLPADKNVNDLALARVSDAGAGNIVLFYDGVFMNQAAVDPFRVNPRHQNASATNLLFIDGHGETVARRLLPAGGDEGTFTSPSTLAHEFWQPSIASHFPQVRWTLPNSVP